MRVAGDPVARRLDRTLEGVLLLLLLFTPLALGGVYPFGEFVVVTLAGVACLLLGARWLRAPESGPVFTPAHLAAALFLLLGAFQLLPLPEGLLRFLSPRTVAVRQELLADLGAAAGPAPVSFYAWGTLHDLRLLLAAFGIFCAAAHLYRRLAPVRRLLQVVSLFAIALAVLAILQIVAGTDKIYGLIPTGHGPAKGGTFINRNNFCLFMNLSLGAMVALLLLTIQQGLQGRPRTVAAVLDWLTSPGGVWVWVLVFGMMTVIAAVFLSLSRGGAVAFLAAGTFTTLVMAARRRLDGRAWIMVCVALGALLCVLGLGFEAVFDRLATLEEKHTYLSRWALVQGVLTAWTRFPLLGTGLGTHAVVYPMFDRTTMPRLAEFAENEYAQTAEETGIVGFLLAGAFVVLLWRAYRRGLQRGGWEAAVTYGLGFALLAAMIQSLGDFGLHIPANLVLMAVLAGSLISLGRTGREPRPRRLPAAAFTLASLLLFGWAVLGGGRALAADLQWREVRRLEDFLAARDWLAGNAVYAELLRRAEAAVRLAPGNVEYRHWLAAYRWRAISRVVDPETGRIVLPPRGPEYVRRILGELATVRRLCPTFGPAYCVAGQLRVLQRGEREAGLRLVRLGFRLTPYHPEVCYVTGLVEALAGDRGRAVAALRRALSLDGRLFGPVCRLLLDRLEAPDLAVELAGDDLSRLRVLMELLQKRKSSGKTWEALASRVRRKTLSAMKQVAERPDADTGVLVTLARLARDERDFATAVRYYRRALAADYAQIQWRLELARVYAAMKRNDDAVREARIVLRLRPTNTQARKLVADLGAANGDSGR